MSGFADQSQADGLGMRRLFLHLAYNGAGYYGWQRVPDGPSVQATLEAALTSLTQQTLTLAVAGRTDRGVHALGQVAHADFPSPLPLIKVLDGLNHYLPENIRIWRVESVPPHLHARYSATARTYRYTMLQRRQANPLRPDQTHIIPALNVPAMQQAVASIPLGEQDWSSFRSSECQSNTPMVHLYHAQLDITPDVLTFTISGNHFLHHMVRIIIGTLLEIGYGKRCEDFPTLLARKDRTQAGFTAPPQGLVLTHVTYPNYAPLDICPD